MRSDHSINDRARLHLIPVLAILVAYFWASWTAGPATTYAPYPLPTQTMAAAETMVPTN
jgi:hypothetical protein